MFSHIDMGKQEIDTAKYGTLGITVAFRNLAIPFGVLTFQVIETGDRTVLLCELRNPQSTASSLLCKLRYEDRRSAFPTSTDPPCLLSHNANSGSGVNRSVQSSDSCLAGDHSSSGHRIVRNVFGTPLLTHWLSLLAC